MPQSIPGTLITINPMNLLQCHIAMRGADKFFTDWKFVTDILHPCDQEPIVQAGHLVTERALNDLHFAGCDDVQVERVDWEAEDLALQEFLDQPIPKPEPIRCTEPVRNLQGRLLSEVAAELYPADGSPEALDLEGFEF